MKTSDGRSTQRSAQGGVHPGKTTKTRVINFIVLIFCFIGSIALWFYVQDYDSPTYEKKFTNISVDIVGETDGYSVLSGYNNTIDVTVIGRKSDINKLYSSDIVAQIDISDITDTGTVSCPVTVILPNGISVSELSANSFWLYIDTTASMTIKVIVTHTGYTENGLIVGTAVASPATVTVSGPVGELRKIAGAYCTLDLGQISGSVSANGTLELRDSSGDAIDNPYMSISTDIVSVSIPVYMQKTLPVTAQFVGGVYSSNMATIVAVPETVALRGTVETMSNLTSIVVDVDESCIDGVGTAVVPITLPTGVENLSGSSTVELNITLLNNGARTFAISGIEAVNVPAGLVYTITTESVNIKVRGIIDALFAFNAEKSLSVTADLSSLAGKTSGTYQIPLTVDSDYSKTAVYPYGSYTVEVVIG